MHIFKDFKALFLFQFIYIKLRISTVEFFHYVDISIGIFRILTYSLFIIFILIAYGDFFKQLGERLYISKSSNKDEV